MLEKERQYDVDVNVVLPDIAGVKGIAQVTGAGQKAKCARRRTSTRRASAWPRLACCCIVVPAAMTRVGT